MVGGGGKRRARAHVSSQHHQPAGECGSREKAAAAPLLRERRLQGRDERHERHAGEQADKDRHHDSLPMCGHEFRQLSCAGAGRWQHTLDEV